MVGKKTQESVCLVNAYSNPQHRSQRFRTLFQKARRKAVDMPIIVAGNFNSSHRELGYPRTTAKGRSLLDEAEEAEFELLSDPQQPSRSGTSATRDTTPDLAFVHLPDDRPVSWRNTGLNLGSDHYIIEVELPLRVRSKQAPTRKPKLTDWNAFRRQEIAPTIEDLEKWTRSLVDAAARVSTEVETDESIPSMDPRLAHLIEARQSLQRRWKRMRHSRTLRKRIAHLGREIEKYSRQLCAQQWHAICNEADGKLHASRTWKLLRHLRDETQSKIVPATPTGADPARGNQRTRRGRGGQTPQRSISPGHRTSPTPGLRRPRQPRARRGYRRMGGPPSGARAELQVGSRPGPDPQ